MRTKGLHPNTTPRKAKVNYKCSKCGRTIPAGEKYYYTNTQFIPPYKNCKDCPPSHLTVTQAIQDEMNDYHSQVDWDDGKSSNGL